MGAIAIGVYTGLFAFRLVAVCEEPSIRKTNFCDWCDASGMTDAVAGLAVSP